MKNKYKILIICATILIIIFLVIYSVYGNVFNNKKENTNTLIEADSTVISKDIIDMNNDTNVKIKNNIKTNNSKKLNSNHYARYKDATNDNDLIIVDNINLTASGYICKFKASIANNTEVDFERFFMYINFYDKEDNILYSTEYVIYDFKSGAKDNINIDGAIDFSNSYDFDIEYDIN